MESHTLLEVCVDSLESAIIAESAGADRIELCQSLQLGGTTPSAGLIRLARERLGIDVFVLVRPRSGDFCYSEHELETIKSDVLMAKEMGVSGIVTGTLTPEGDVHEEQMHELIRAARPMAVTFHRAFDMTKNPAIALETLISLGVDRVLTSGQMMTALKGLGLIRDLTIQARGRIIVMPGAGVDARNIKKIVTESHASEIHMSGKMLIGSEMTYRNHRIDMGSPQMTEYERYVTNAASIQAARRALTCTDSKVSE